MATPIPNNRARFTISEVLTATGGSLRGPLGDSALAIEGVATDTRSIGPGEAFVALKGERFDGHDHVAQAAARGAALAIVERSVDACGITMLRVASTLEALQRLAALHLAKWRETSGGRVVAVTGSAGKTTTTRAIARLLASRGKVAATRGNLNNQVGVPMTALAIAPAIELCVFELGTNSPGEIGKLARTVRPDLGLVTLIDQAHTLGLGSIEAVEHEKTALYRELGNAATAVGNADDERVLAGLSRCSARTRIGYGHGAEAQYRIVRRVPRGLDSATLELVRPSGSPLSFATPLLGRAGALATAAAVAVCEALSGSPLEAEQIEAALEQLVTIDEGPGRMQPRALPSGLVLVDDSYNANPASCRASIEAARELAASLGRRLVLVLGEMRELGGEGQSAHVELGGAAGTSGARLFIAVAGQALLAARRAAELGQASEFCDTASEAAALAVARVEASDLVLVKGSRGVATELVVAALCDAHGVARSPVAGPGHGVAP